VKVTVKVDSGDRAPFKLETSIFEGGAGLTRSRYFRQQGGRKLGEFLCTHDPGHQQHGQA